MSNDSFKVEEPYRGQGLGTQIFASEVRALTDNHVSYIDTIAAGVGKLQPTYDPNDPDRYNGFYTWFQLGYDSPIYWQGIYFSGFQEADVPPQFKVNTLHELGDVPGGKEFWAKYGTSYHGVFDLTPGSKHHEILDEYVQDKGFTYVPGKGYS